jgi:hypothetical protein
MYKGGMEGGNGSIVFDGRSLGARMDGRKKGVMKEGSSKSKTIAGKKGGRGKGKKE